MAYKTIWFPTNVCHFEWEKKDKINLLLREGFIKKKVVIFPLGGTLQKVGKNLLILYAGSKKCFYAKKIFMENFSTLPMNISLF